MKPDRIYCSGPLFCAEEVGGICAIAGVLENSGFQTFLTHRDGLERRPLHNHLFCPISSSAPNFNPRNIPYIPPVKIFAFLELEQNRRLCKGLERYLVRFARVSDAVLTQVTVVFDEEPVVFGSCNNSGSGS